MPTDKDKLDIPEIGTSRDNPYRHSLQPKGAAGSPILRLTQSQNYKKKKVKVPPIPENEESEEKKQEKEVKVTVDVVNEQVKMPRGSKGSRKGSQASKLGIDNAAFEIEDGGRISRGNSAASSVRSSMRDPSVQSLTVVRQQYWCCSRWTPFERNLCITVVILTLTIVALLLAVGLLASREPDKHEVHNSTTTISTTFSEMT